MSYNFKDLAEILSALSGVAIVATMLYNITQDKESRKLFVRLIRPKSTKIHVYKTGYSTAKQVPLVAKATYVLNFSLVKSIVMTIAPSETNEESKKSKTIVGLLLMEKMKKSSSIILILLLSIFTDLGFQQFSDYNSHGYVTLIAAFLWSAIIIEHKIIELRIRKGWYGKNEFEAREIINFALAHANKDDFNDQGGLKRIVPLPDIPEAETSPSRAWGTHA